MRSHRDRLQDFRYNKYALFLKTGNMYDINNMELRDFLGVLDYLQYTDKFNKNQPVPLKDSQRKMIEEAKKRNIG